MRYIAPLIVAVLLIAGCRTSIPDPPQQEVKTHIQFRLNEDVISLAQKSLVTIQSNSIDVGHGVIINYQDKPHILTAYHVVRVVREEGAILTAVSGDLRFKI